MHFTSPTTAAFAAALRFLLRQSNLFWPHQHFSTSSNTLSTSSSSTSFSSSQSKPPKNSSNGRKGDLPATKASSFYERHFFLAKNSARIVKRHSFSHFSSTPAASSSTMTGSTRQEDNEREEDTTEQEQQPIIPLNTHAIRKLYLNLEEPFLLEKDMHKCPFQQFDSWFKNVMECVDLKHHEVNAFSLSTVGPNGRPSSRMLLLKGYSQEGFVFFTHSISRKCRELAENPQAAILFYWSRVDRQVRIEGRVCQLSAQIADEYWQMRPIASRIGSKLSEQSAQIPGREYLMQKQRALEELCEREGQEAITRPDDWLGYALQPDCFEFWQGQTNRVHDRIVYQLEEQEEDDNNKNQKTPIWKMKRLAP